MTPAPLNRARHFRWILVALAILGLATPSAVRAAIGDALWSNGYNAGGQSAVDGTGAIASAGNFFGAVTFGGPTITPGSFGGDVYLTRHDGDGNHLWTLQFTPVGGCNIDAMDTDENGNIFIAGTLSAGEFAPGLDSHARRAPAAGGSIDFGGGSISGDYELFVAGFDASGNHLFSFVIGQGFAQDLSAGGGQVVLTGYTYGSLDFGGGPIGGAGGADLFIGSLTTGGAHTWSAAFGDASDQGGFAVATDATGGCVLAATTESAISFGGATLTPTSVGLCLVRFSQSGVHEWSQLFDGNFSGGSGIYAVLDVDVSSVDDRIALVGESYGTSDVGGGPLTSAGQGDVLVAVYDGTGAHQWSAVHGGTSYDAAQGVAFDSQGNVFTTGTFASTACNFGGASFSPVASFTDFFVALYDASGAHVWSNALGYASYQIVLDAGVGPDGALFVSGYAADGADLGGGPLTYGSLCHAQFEGVPSGATAAPSTPRHARLHAAAPNPFNPSTTIRLSVTRSAPVALEIFDARGRHVRTLHRGSLDSGDHDFVWQGRSDVGETVASGIYHVRLASDGDFQTQKLVLVK
jgi:hypothetical protein